MSCRKQEVNVTMFYTNTQIDYIQPLPCFNTEEPQSIAYSNGKEITAK